MRPMARSGAIEKSARIALPPVALTVPRKPIVAMPPMSATEATPESGPAMPGYPFSPGSSSVSATIIARPIGARGMRRSVLLASARVSSSASSPPAARP